LTSKKYAKTIDLLCEGNKVFVKYQAQGEGFNPNPLCTPLPLSDNNALSVPVFFGHRLNFLLITENN